MTRGAAVGLLCLWMSWPAEAGAADARDGAAEPARREMLCSERYRETVRSIRGPVFNPDYMTADQRARHEEAMREAESKLKDCVAGKQTE